MRQGMATAGQLELGGRPADHVDAEHHRLGGQVQVIAGQAKVGQQLVGLGVEAGAGEGRGGRRKAATAAEVGGGHAQHRRHGMGQMGHTERRSGAAADAAGHRQQWLAGREGHGAAAALVVVAGARCALDLDHQIALEVAQRQAGSAQRHLLGHPAGQQGAGLGIEQADQYPGRHTAQRGRHVDAGFHRQRGGHGLDASAAAAAAAATPTAGGQPQRGGHGHQPFDQTQDHRHAPGLHCCRIVRCRARRYRPNSGANRAICRAEGGRCLGGHRALFAVGCASLFGLPTPYKPHDLRQPAHRCARRR